MKPPPVFLTEEQIAKRVEELGQKITRDLKGKSLICISILKGSVVFFSDLIRHIDLPVEVDFLGAASYGTATETTGVVKITLDLHQPIEGKDILLIEDIVDTGVTLDYITGMLKLRNPASLRICALLLKPARLRCAVPIDYLGFTTDDRFIIGYGLDLGEKYRNLPYLGWLPEEEARKEIAACARS